MVDAATLLLFVGAAGVEDDAVARLGGTDELEGNTVGADPLDLAEIDAALGAEAGVGEFLVLDAAEPAGVEAAGETHLKVVKRLAAHVVHHGVFRGRRRPKDFGHHLIERLAVDAGDAGDVFALGRPGFLREATPERTRSGRTSRPERSCG